MRFIFGVLVMALAGMPGLVVAAQAPSNAELTKQLDALERRIEGLERRENKETKAAKSSAAAAQTPAAKPAPTKADWGRVMTRMSEDQVRGILGPPVRSRNDRNFTIWSWHDPTIRGGEVWLQDGMVERVYPPLM